MAKNIAEWTVVREYLRNFFHLTALLSLIAYEKVSEWFGGNRYGLLALLGGLVFFLIVDLLRVELRWRVKPLIWRLFIKEREANQFSSALYFFASIIICLAVFRKDIAYAAIFITAIGDVVAHEVSKRLHYFRFVKKRSVEGVFAGLAVNLIVGMFFLPLKVAIAMACVASFVEAITEKVDDNFAVPLIAGFVGSLVAWILGL